MAIDADFQGGERMSRYINADILLAYKFKNDISCNAYHNLIKREAHTVDAVELVRCNDCSLGEARQRKTGEHIIHGSYTNRTMDDDDFCSNGRVIK